MSGKSKMIKRGKMSKIHKMSNTSKTRKMSNSHESQHVGWVMPTFDPLTIKNQQKLFYYKSIFLWFHWKVVKELLRGKYGYALC